MSIYEHSKPIDIRQLQIRHHGLGFQVEKSDRIVTDENRHLIDIDSITQLLTDNQIKTLTIRPNTSNSTSFVCRLNAKKIVLITKTSVKKTTYQLTIANLALTVNDRASDRSMLDSFIHKLDHILKLVHSEKATAYGN